MTIDEAIRIIKIVLAVAEDFEITVQGEELTKEKCKEAVEMTIKALKQEPCEGESEVQNVGSSISFSKETNSFISCLKCENFSKEDNYCKLLQINWLPDNFGCNNGKEKVGKGK